MMNDMTRCEDQRVIFAAGVLRQVREGREYDAADAGRSGHLCSQDDVDRARRLIKTVDWEGELRPNRLPAGADPRPVVRLTPA